jgi:hypothetical protein
MTAGALRSVSAMLGYIDKRVARSDATAKGLLMGVSMRRKALEMLGSTPTAREEIAKARLASAGEIFAAGSKEQIERVEAAQSTNVKLGLPYLAKRYDDLVALLQWKPLCAPGSSSWREAGCVALRAKFDGATMGLKTTLPSQIASGLAAMAGKGADPTLIDEAKKKLQAGDVKGAAVLHDAALRGVEGL